MQPPDAVPLTPEQRTRLIALIDGSLDTKALDGLALLELEVLAGALRAAHQQIVAAHDRRRARIGQQGKETRHG
jgi:hypothetical protein